MAALWLLVQLWIACGATVVAALILNLRAMNAALFAPVVAALVLVVRAFV